MQTALTVAGVVIRQDSKGRYSLNDFHRACGGADKHQPANWLRLQQTKELVSELESEIPQIRGIATKQGTGTFVARELVFAYAMWVSPAFHLKVIRTFDRAAATAIDWRKERSRAASTTKVANDILKMVRAEAGKDTEGKHYMSEQKLVNWSVSGEFKGLDRDALSADDLALLAYLEERNAVLIGRGIAYEQRKPMLSQYAKDWRMARAMPALVQQSAEAR